MAKDDAVEHEGVVVAAERGAIFEVDVPFPSGDTILTKRIIATLSGKMRQFQIKIVVGDGVKVACSPYDMTRGRIIHRNR